jgi:hypothetical protein
MSISHFSNSQCNFSLERQAICNVEQEDVKGLWWIFPKQNPIVEKIMHFSSI